MTSGPVPATTVVVCAHNEDAYIGECLQGLSEQTQKPSRIVLVADRCTDDTVALARKLLPEGSIIIEKSKVLWNNSYAENLEIGRGKAVGDFLAIVDADIRVPPSFLEKLTRGGGQSVCKSAIVKTDPRKGWLNWAVSLWERTYSFTPLGREPRGGARIISMSALEDIGGFRDVMAPDTDLDIRLRGHSMRVSMNTDVVALHLRKMTLRASISRQILAGKKRRQLGIPFLRTFLHSLIRLRPFVVCGYLRKGKAEVAANATVPRMEGG